MADTLQSKGGHNSAILGEKPDRKSGPTNAPGARGSRAAQAAEAGHREASANGSSRRAAPIRRRRMP